MKPEWRQSMMSAISEVIETMFFIMVGFEGRGTPAQPVCCESSIQLWDEDELTLRFQVVAEFARVITANFLGTDEDQIRAEELEDAMKELANMVGGNFQPRIPGRNWRLGIPSFRNLDENVEEEETESTASQVKLPLFYFGEPVGMVVMELRNRK